VKTIPLSNGGEAMVDDCDYDRIASYKWRRLNSGYAARNAWIPSEKRYRTLLMHREVIGAPEGSLVDHADRNGLNNTRENLRLATVADNQSNRTSLVGRGRLKGVWWHQARGHWVAEIKIAGKKRYLGSFADEASAGAAYAAAANESRGEFALQNTNAAGPVAGGDEVKQ
jgi:hypothetical protein